MSTGGWSPSRVTRVTQHPPDVAVTDLRCGGGDVVDVALGAAVCEELVGHVRQVDADDGEGVPETTQVVSLLKKVVQSILGSHGYRSGSRSEKKNRSSKICGSYAKVGTGSAWNYNLWFGASIQ